MTLGENAEMAGEGISIHGAMEMGLKKSVLVVDGVYKVKQPESKSAAGSSSSCGMLVEVEKIDIGALPKKYAYRFVKRTFDIAACSIALIVLAIPMCVIAGLIKKDSAGPVLYKQERIGFNGKPFMILKFRSMMIDAEATGAQWAQEDDPRVTKIGRVLRNTRLDEIPQFFNVVRGEMSLIGPRPERQIFYEKFEQYIPGFRQRLMIKPGVSGLAQVIGGYNLLPEEKIIYDIEYIKNRSILLDTKIIFKTIAIVFTQKGAR